MKNLRLHLIVLVLVVVAEKIGNIAFTLGVGKIVLLPMMYALLMGVLTAPRFLKISRDTEINAASSLLGVTLMLLMAKYGTLVGPSLPKILAASPALILQEFGNLGRMSLLSVSATVLMLRKVAALWAFTLPVLLSARFSSDSWRASRPLIFRFIRMHWLWRQALALPA